MIDVKYGTGDQSDVLSNLARKPFTFRGIRFQSIEGVLQSLKLGNQSDPNQGGQFCGLWGFEAKKRGQPYTKLFQTQLVLWWEEECYDRMSDDYQLLLDEIFASCYGQCKQFRTTLRAFKDELLDHTIGHNLTERTVLTKDEFISRLNTLKLLT